MIYIGTKIIKAERGCDITGRTAGKDGYRLQYEDGYISWSPKAVFEKAYRPIDGMNFGLAIEALKLGKKVSRKGWNGKGMFIYLTTGSIIPVINLKQETAKKLFGEHALLECDATVNIQSHIDMKAADGSIIIGWLASQTDMLAEDWRIVG
ncbi:DUF2829 domain-containing protein [Pectinatus frisingensis]|uniref:DUF2829 domain-containing protein n=1 Tax=Pectinatus frisingensis TaxID=865 RepID=UPI0018C4AE02|nr:DUF2829 domain-containing protein [Pectinatus frisingensis]